MSSRSINTSGKRGRPAGPLSRPEGLEEPWPWILTTRPASVWNWPPPAGPEHGPARTVTEPRTSRGDLHVPVRVRCVWSASEYSSRAKRLPLSIPVWSDWDSPPGCPVRGLMKHFQSHFGAIGTITVEYIRRARYMFQSQFGAIGSGAAGGPPTACNAGFNPSLVRLDLAQNIVALAILPAFQSQFGAIGSRHGLHLPPVDFSFQSQFGAIGSPPWSSLIPSFMHVSIPVWCDWIPPYPRPSPGESIVSIPVWCDWIPRRSPMCQCWALCFNPSLVRLDHSLCLAS